MKIGLLPSEVSIRISEFSKKFSEAIWIELPKYDYSEDKNDKYVCTAPELHTWMSPDSKRYTDLVFNESKYIQDHPEIECSIKYPLNTPCNFKVDLTGNGGFLCITDIILQVCKMYRQIYKEEKETTSKKPGKLKNSYNRNTTTGVWGIWGHDLSDLELNDIILDTEDNTLNLIISS